MLERILLYGVVSVVTGVFIFYTRNVISPVLEIPDINLRDQLVVITGGCSGIGKGTAQILFSVNHASLVLGCRNVTMAKELCSSLRSQVQDARKCFPFELDLASFDSVRHFASDIGFIPGIQPNILVLNAGVRQSTFTKTQDGFETHYQVNHLSHFLLVNILLPLMLRSTHEVRIGV